MGKGAGSVSIIGGADGPTSIFIAGKGGKVKLTTRIQNYFRKIKRNRIKKRITANPHTLEEVVELLKREKIAAEIADDIFPLDFHIYEIKCPENCIMQIGVETVWQVIDGSFSGDKKTMKEMKKLFREIYLYYGVTAEDIKNETERYKSFLAALCS